MRRWLRGSRGLVRRGREGPGGHPAGGRGLGARATFAFAERGVRPTAGRRRSPGNHWLRHQTNRPHRAPSPAVLPGAMKLNKRSVAHYALSDSPADHTGFLRTWGGPGTPPTPSGTGRRCWFVLKGNLLFSFESREGRAPLSLVVLEGCTVELAEAPVPEEFAFAIRFDAPGVRPHLLAADGQVAQEAWVKALSRASFGYMRLVVRELESQLQDARRSLALHRCVSQKVGASCRKPQVPDRRSPGLENGHFLPRDCSPVRTIEERGCRPVGRDLSEWELQGPTSLLLGRGQSPVSPETSCFSTLHDWYGQEIVQLRRGWQQRAQRNQAGCKQQNEPCS
nr:sesquipedalian-2 [Cavia porcellus]